MKKILSKLIVISLLFIMASGVNTQASVVDNTSNNASIEEVQFIDITREEYVQAKAEKEGISFEEADKLEKLQTEESIKNELNTKRRFSIMPLATETVYRQVTKTYPVGTSGSFNSKLVSTINTKIIRYTGSSYGTYQKFAEILDKNVQAYGSGTATYSPGTISAVIDYNTSYGNSIVFMFSGNVEHQVGWSLAQEAKKIGFSVSGSWNYIARKYVTKNTTFSSNWNLN
ncbi:MAG: hypothetical protein E6860_18760 [Clostridium sp.]|uniref:hypothetical protein n=1 Tax=Clostridium TaxID=1485 RepID=UPI002330D4E9|nr:MULTISPECIES: hypothetical protein [Clostridium]MDB2073961.1 hypothetical protein [Clostridium paraputrificum]MDB2084136.1 hypothetical protein [Clostridium paraputrificum]MDU1587564.1 hypothetical protein [Clostridium sp.]